MNKIELDVNNFTLKQKTQAENADFSDNKPNNDLAFPHINAARII